MAENRVLSIFAERPKAWSRQCKTGEAGFLHIGRAEGPTVAISCRAAEAVSKRLPRIRHCPEQARQNRRSRFLKQSSGRRPDCSEQLPRSRGRVKEASPDQAKPGPGTARSRGGKTGEAVFSYAAKPHLVYIYTSKLLVPATLGKIPFPNRHFS